MVLLILAAASGTGKGTVGRALMARNPDLRLSVSHTTRARRVGEEDGVHYHFVDRPTFDGLLADDGFAEWAEYVGNRYGTAHATIEAAREAGHDLILDIEVQGADQVRAAYPDDAVAVFLLPPTWAALRDRLEKRGTDDRARIERRLARGREELREAHRFEYLVVNDDLDQAVAEVEAIYRAARTRVTTRRHLLEPLRIEAEGR